MNEEFGIESNETMHHSKPFSCKSDDYFVEKINEYRQSVIKAQRKAGRASLFLEEYGLDSKKLYAYAYVGGCSAGHDYKYLICDEIKDLPLEVTEKGCIRKEGEVSSAHRPVNPYFKKEDWSKR